MKITFTLSRYLAQRYAVNFMVLLCALLAIIYLFDTVELIRRASKRDDVPLGLVLQMGLFKLPEVGQTLLPFAVLFSAMFTFWQLTRRYELIIVRASGFSVWQFLTPVILVAVSIGALQMSVINPVGAVLIGKFEDMERTYLSRQKNQIAVFTEGLWLRQPILIDTIAGQDEDATSTAPQPIIAGQEDTTKLIEGYAILHAPRIDQKNWRLHDITIFYFTNSNDFVQRIDAKTAVLHNQEWQLDKATLHNWRGPAIPLTSYRLPTSLTREEIMESFASPESMSFWKLPSYIRTLEQTGFDATQLRVYYHNLLAQPLMFCAMILLAAAVSMKPPRSKGAFTTIAAGVFIGFILFFLSSFLQALGASHQIPVTLAAWSPALIAFLLGLSVMMNKEDG